MSGLDDMNIALAIARGRVLLELWQDAAANERIFAGRIAGQDDFFAIARFGIKAVRD